MWWEHWFGNETCERINKMVDSGMVKLVDGRLALQTREQHKPVWLHIGSSTDSRKCVLWTDVFYKGLKTLHSFCRYNCWKVVMVPRNFREMFQLHNLMNAVPFFYNFVNPIPGKVGLDLRHYTRTPYNAFCYTQSLEECLRVKEIMHYMIRTHMKTELIDGKYLHDTVEAKRSCTEFENAKPTSDPYWNTPQTPEEAYQERRFEELFYYKEYMTFQPAWLKDKTIHEWAMHCNSLGDRTVEEMFSEGAFTVNCVKYSAQDLRSQGGDPESDALESAEDTQNKENESWQ